MLRKLSLLIVTALAASTPADAGPAPPRTVRFTYRVVVGPVPDGVGPVHVFVPLPRDDEHQRVLERVIDSSIPGRTATEPKHANLFWHGSVAVSDGKPIEVTVRTLVERKPFRREGLDRAARRDLSARERAQYRYFLRPDARVPVGAPILAPILSEVRRAAGSDDPARIARATYDWVVANMEYKKVGTGWGNGDTHWACSARFGNCTDFHSLFTSLARSEGIPARFEIGFSIPESQASGTVAGYHCWAQFYLPGVGWVPIDASEAAKDPSRKDELFGSQGADRVLFTVGRDLDLGDGHRSGPLNYFIYPHVEVAGQRYDGPVTKTFTFDQVEQSEKRASRDVAGAGDAARR